MSVGTERFVNPAPLGLFGFGMTTVLLNLHNVGVYPVNSMILAMGMAYGGLAQVIAGILEFRRGNTFGTVAFTSYGLFWWSLVLLLLLPTVGLGGDAASVVQATSPIGMAAYFVLWGLFTVGMFGGTVGTNRVLQFVFISLAILFFLLAIRDAFGITGWYATAVGIEGILCGLSAFYLALAEVLNDVHGRSVLPIGSCSK